MVGIAGIAGIAGMVGMAGMAGIAGRSSAGGQTMLPWPMENVGAGGNTVVDRTNK